MMPFCLITASKINASSTGRTLFLDSPSKKFDLADKFVKINKK